MNNNKKSGKLKYILIGIIAFIVIIYLTTGGVEEAAKQQLNEIEVQVAQDAVKQYEIAVKGGDKMDIYVHAGLVAAAYLQAKDEENYKKWKEIENKAGEEAGIPK